MRYQESRKRKEINGFGGLDRTDGAGDGYLSEAVNLSSRRFPFLAPREGRKLVQACAAGSALFAWGDLVVVDGTELRYKGEVVGSVLAGPKQFAVVNTRLVIWPDKVYLDLDSGELKRLDGAAELHSAGAAGNVTLADAALTVRPDPEVRKDANLGGFAGGLDEWNPLVYTYGTDPEAVGRCWDGTAWDLEALGKLERLSGFFTSDGADDSVGFQPGRIVIPKGDSVNALTFVYGTHYVKAADGYAAGTTVPPDRSRYNTHGWYGVLTHFPEDESSNGVPNGTVGIVGNGAYPGSYIRWAVDIYQAGTGNPIFSELFAVGDAVTVTGTPCGAQDVERRTILSMDETNNALTFAAGTFPAAPAATCLLTEALARGGSYYLDDGKACYRLKPERRVAAGRALLLMSGESGYEVRVWDVEKKQAVQSCAVTGASLTAEDRKRVTVLKLEPYALPETLTVRKEVPELDYICESGNRLWGVSNRDRTIYASSLGLPDRFYDYAGLSTDSYAAAVGSDGDWSGIIDYSGSVLCWKEDVLHRVAGDYPATYSVYTDSFAGVEIGSHRSMVILNEVLYYKGRNGVYAYTGGQPVCVSQRLGDGRYTGGVAGVLGERYYLSVQDGAGSRELFTYDTGHGVWYREDQAPAELAALNGRLYGLLEDGVYEMAGGPVSDVEWSGMLAEFTEGSCQKRMYRWLRIGAEIGEDSWLRVEISVDGRPAELVWQTGEPGRRQLNLPLRGMRAERMSVTLSGKGDVVIRYVTRDYIELSEER